MGKAVFILREADSHNLLKYPAHIRRIVDPDERLAKYQEIEQYLIDNQVFIPIFQPTCVYILQDRVKNFTLSWNGWTDMSFYAVSLEG